MTINNDMLSSTRLTTMTINNVIVVNDIDNNENNIMLL